METKKIERERERERERELLEELSIMIEKNENLITVSIRRSYIYTNREAN